MRDAIDAALADLRAMERRLRELEARLGAAGPAELTEYGDLLGAYEIRGGYDADARVDKATNGLGLAHLDRDRALGSLSGGERARPGLACLLASAPEVMLLDEPTNHLDTTALTWLEDHLRAHRGTVVAVSHDRVFLERVTTAVLEVDGDRRTVTRYGDGYAGFLAERARARQRWEERYREWCEEVDRLTEFAATTARSVAHDRPMRDRNKTAYDQDRGRVQSSVASRVRNATERLRRSRADPVPRPPDPLRLTATLTGGRPTGAVAALRDVRVGDRLRVDEFTVGPVDRLLIHGPNGAGKTTLLRVVAGDLAPDRGEARRGGRVGYLAQEVRVRRSRETVLAAFAAGLPGPPDEHAGRLASLGLFRPGDLRVPVGSLSAGQVRRLALARLVATETDLLLLDEPTNHLSLALVEELEEALGGYGGALVVVSHDRRLRDRFTGRHREMRSGRLVG